ncbi:MAG: LamG domain-containing protein [Ferruginibacter sp.]
MKKILSLVLIYFTFSTAAQAQYKLTQSGLLNGSTVFTVEFWVKTNDTRTNNTYWQRPFIFGNETNGDNSGDFGITINNGYIGMFEGLSNLNTDQQFLSTSVRINDNFWHNVTAVNNGQTINLYVDGNIVGSLVSGRQLSTQSAALTFGAASLDHTFNGNFNNTNFASQSSFGDARISNIARYTSNFQPPNSFVSDGSTVALYHFSEQSNNFSNTNNNGFNPGTNLAINVDPNYPVTFDANMDINNDYAQTATLFVNDSVVLYGKLLLAKKDWSFSAEIGVHFFENGSKKMKYFKTEEIKGFKMGNNYFVPKFLGQGSAESIPSRKTMVRVITPPNSRINMYEYIAQSNTKNPSGYVEYHSTPIHFVNIPGAKDDKVYQFCDNKFVPHFDTRVSAMVADKPALAEKIKSKDKSYFYQQISELSRQEKVWWNIVNEYNQQ